MHEWPISQNVLGKLSQKKYRSKAGLYFIEGAAMVRDAILAGAPVLGLYYDNRVDQRSGDLGAIETADRRNIPVEKLDPNKLAKLSELKTPPPVMALLEMPADRTPSMEMDQGLILALDRVTDPGNIGTLIRAAAFFGVKSLWLGEGCADPYNPKVIRAAMSSHFHLDLFKRVNLENQLAGLRDAGAEILVTEIEGAEQPGFLDSGNKTTVLVLGSEPHGTSAEILSLATKRLAIPRTGPIDSLNVAMAGTVILDRLSRK